MIFKNIKMLGAALALVCANASATLITFETRDIDHDAINHGIDNTDFAASWLAQDSTIVSNEISEFTNMNSGKDSISHLQIDLALNKDSVDWVFDFGLDAGFGAAVYLDGELISSRTDDLWWSNNWGNSDVFTVELNDLTPSNKVLDIYWAEHCCDGTSSIRFQNDAGEWNNLSVDNLAAASIPEPTTIALIAMGLFGLARRQMQK